MAQAQKNTWNSPLKLGIGILVVAKLIVAAQFINIQEILKGVLDWIDSLGAWGAVALIVIYIVATVLFIPGSILTLGAGFLFGVIQGTILVSVGATIGATAAFLVGRYLARGWVSKQLEGKPKFQAIDEAVAREGWKIVGLTRLSPIFPFNLLNYGLGLTQVSLRDYFFPTWIGIIPGTILYVYLGSLASDFATLGAGERSRTPAEWAFYGIGLVATAAVTWYVTRVARKALNRKVDTSDGNPD